MRLLFLVVSILVFSFSYSQRIGLGAIDAAGNKYKSIIIGNQEWFEDNLRTIKYSNGQQIAHISDSIVWSKWEEGAFVYYKHDTRHGILYNWYTVNDARGICPIGWKVPSNSDWDTLITFLGGNRVAGGKLKARLHWADPNTGATNAVGFHALPKGCYGINGSFNGIGRNAYWWSSSENGELSAWGREIGFNEVDVFVGHGDKRDGLSIRCLKE
jgi:uncharacterized protein (TIGR02145 family)